MSKESAESAKKTIDKERTVKKRAARSIVAPKIDEDAYTVRSSSKETIFIPGTPKPVREKAPAKVIASPVNVSQAPVKKREARVIKAPGGMMPNEDERSVSTQQSVISSGGNGWPDRPPTPRVMLQPEGAKLSRELTSAVRTDTIKAEVRGQIRAEVQKQAQEAAEKSQPEVKEAESQAPEAMSQPLGSEAAKPGPMKLNLPEPPKRDGIPVGPARPGAQPQPAQEAAGPSAQGAVPNAQAPNAQAAGPNVQGGAATNAQAPNAQIPAGHTVQAAAAPVSAGAVSPAIPEPGQTQRSVTETVVNVPDSTGKPRKVVKTVVTTTTTTYESVEDDEYKELTGAVNGAPVQTHVQQPQQARPAAQQPQARPAPVIRTDQAQAGAPVVRKINEQGVPVQNPQQAARPAAQQPQQARPAVQQPQAHPAAQPQPVQQPQAHPAAQQQQVQQPQVHPTAQPQQVQHVQPQARPVVQQVHPQPVQQPVQQVQVQPESIIDVLPIPTTTAPAPQPKPMSPMDRQLAEIEKALGLSQDTTQGVQTITTAQGTALNVQTTVPGMQGIQGTPGMQGTPAMQGVQVPGQANNVPAMDEQTKKATEYLMLGVECLVFLIVLCVLITISQKIKKMDKSTGAPETEMASDVEADDSDDIGDSGTESFDVEQAGSEDEIPSDGGMEMLDSLDSGSEMSDAPSGSVDVDNDDFTLHCTNVTVKLDTEGNPAALIYFTFTNKTSKQLSMSEVFPPSVTQNGEPCETYASLEEYPDEFYNKDMQISDGSSLDCCYAVSLKDAVSPLRLTIHDNYESFSDIGSTEIAIQ